MLWIALRSHGLLVVAASVAMLWLRHPWVYAIDFSLGLAAYLERDRLSRWIGGLPTPASAGLAVISLALWTAPALLGDRDDLPATGSRLTIPLQALGSLGFVLLAVHRARFGRALATRPLLWLGRVSYSLYLVHFSLLLVIAPRLGGHASWSVGVVLYSTVLASSLLAAELGHRFVEIPSIRAGNRICRWLAGSAAGAGVPSERAGTGDVSGA
jgi:peptidoglycan/LPS O-acetylase OafA/YrhL